MASERGKTLVWWLSGLLVTTVLVFLRQPRQARDVVWAEDGGIFLHQALQEGGTGLLTPYEGYVHFLPRLAAALTVAFTEPAAYALSMNILGCFAVACVAGMVFHCASALTDEPWVRLAFASVVPLIGAGPLETTGNLANLHWYLLFLTPFLLVRRSHGRRGMVLLFGAGLMVSLTEILAVVFLPMALAGLRNKDHWAARLGLAVGLTAQVLATLGSPRTNSTAEPMGIQSIILGWFVNSGGTIVYGTGSQLGSVVSNFGPAPLILTSLPFLCAFGFVLWKGAHRHRLMALALLLGSAVIWVAIQVVNPSFLFDYAEFTPEAWREVRPARYAVIVSMLVLASLPLVLAVLPRAAGAARAAVAAILITLQLTTLLPSDTARRYGPDWGVSVQQAVTECSRLATEARVELPIAPVGWFADRVSIPCTLL